MAPRSLVLALVLGVACGSDDKHNECTTDSDCGAGVSCLWLLGEGKLACAAPCDADADCSGSNRCEEAAASCQTCQDRVRICR